MAERKTIKIISIGQWKDVGKAKVLTFAGEDRINYETWSEILAEHIKVGVTIEADVEFTENVSQGTTYFHNKVVQIYIDGQPVKSKGRGFTPDTPEKMASIESQKRADLICQLWIAGKITDNDPLIVKALTWLGKLGAESIVSSQPTKVKASAPEPTDNFDNLFPHEILPAQQPPGQFANAGEFLMACSKNLMLNKTQVLTYLGVTTLDKINFTDAYALLKESKAPDEFDKTFPPRQETSK